MSRESCIVHQPKQAIAIVRQDYYELMEKDACAAALLNIFEYWANAALAADPTLEQPWVGARPIREFEQMMLGIATDKQIRKRLALLEKRGFIHTKVPTQRGAAKQYQVRIPNIQRALVGHVTSAPKPPRSFDRYPVGQTTEEDVPRRSNDPPSFGQITDAPSVKQPNLRRSNDRALKKISPEFKPESFKESFFESELAEKTSAQTQQSTQPIQVGTVTYRQLPEAIDLSELWATNPTSAKAQIRRLAPGHKRPEMVVHGFGEWWVGPGLNDFDEDLIKACQKRKRKFQQPDSVSDAKTFINNMLKNGDWGNLALRCDEATELRERAVKRPKIKLVGAQTTGNRNPFVRSPQEQRASAVGLARFKVSQGNVEGALVIAQQFEISNAEIGLLESA